MSLLRYYQTEATDSIFSALKQYDSTALIMPTGTGKTPVICVASERHFSEVGKRILFLADRKRLIIQARKQMLKWTKFKDWEIEIEMGQRRARHLTQSPIVLGSIKSVYNRLRDYNPDDFSMIIVDECDRSAAKMCSEIIAYFQPVKLVGVTATPYRLDGKPIIGTIYKSIAYVFELSRAILEGYLVPFRSKQIEVEGLDLSNISNGVNGDFDEDQLNNVLCQEENIHKIVVPTLKEYENRQTIVYCVTIDHARFMSEIFNRYMPGSARAIHSELSDDIINSTIDKFENSEFPFLCNCELLTRGVDIQIASCIVMARPTKSEALYWQMIGRILRLLGESGTMEESIANGKSDALIIDYVGNCGKHKQITAESLFDTLFKNKSEEARRRASKKFAENKQLTLFDAMQQAEEEIEFEELEKQKAITISRDNVKVGVKYTVKELNNHLALLGLRIAEDRERGVDVTDNQKDILLKNGFTEDDVAILDKAEAIQIIDRIINRQKEGKCSLKQMKILNRYGLDGDVSFDLAKAVIDIIASNSWKVSDSVRKEINDMMTSETGDKLPF